MLGIVEATDQHSVVGPVTAEALHCRPQILAVTGKVHECDQLCRVLANLFRGHQLTVVDHFTLRKFTQSITILNISLHRGPATTNFSCYLAAVV